MILFFVYTFPEINNLPSYDNIFAKIISENNTKATQAWARYVVANVAQSK